MDGRFGFEAKLYRNTGSYGSPTWNEVTKARDTVLNLNPQEVETSSRNDGGFMTAEPGLIDASVEFTIRANSSDEDYEAFIDALFARTTIEVLCVDAAVNHAGCQGLRATMHVFQGTRNEGLGDKLETTFRLRPAPSAANVPAWYSDSGTTTTTGA